MPLVRPTRRGVVLAAVAVAAVATGVAFGARSLDAVVLPSLVALVAAGAQLFPASPPAVERSVPPPGVPGTGGTVSLDVSTGTSATAAVSDRLPAGLDGDPETTALVGEGAPPVEYEVTYRDRGAHRVGPATVRVRDVLGLAERTFVAGGESTVLVYPRVFRPSAAVGERLRSLSAPDEGAERGTFDHLREYDRSDSLRDVHWKSSAKRDDLVVQEFVEDGDRRTVTVAARAVAGHVDRMAEAAATVGYALLAEGVGVALVTPTGRLTVHPGDADRLLAHLARTGPGTVAAHDATVRIDATREGTTVAVDGATFDFDPGRRRRLDGTAARPTAREVAP